MDVQINCPHCGARFALATASHEIENGSGVGRRLQGDDHVCETCENEIGVYYYRT